MNIHESKCRSLKAVRKKLADAVGVDLHQRECRNPGNCKGTCPKCEAEEKKLNEALLKRGAVAAMAAAMSVGLAGCSSQDLVNLRNFLQLAGQEKPSPDDVFELEGEVAYPEPTLEPDDYIEELIGEVDYAQPEIDPIDEYELMGDVAYEP